MHPVLFHFGSITIYTYGFFIALGAVAGGLYMWKQGNKEYGMSFDQANTLFVLLIVAGVVGGKLFMIFENPSYYFKHLSELFTANGFVFYGSLLTAIPLMLWYFKKNKLPVRGMLDIMAVVTCLVHGFGRIGCFNAGCCYGLPTDKPWGVIFTDTACQARPLGESLHPTQLYEAAFIFCIAFFLLWLKPRKKFDGQLFLTYLMTYAAGRCILEIFRGDLQRGFIFNGLLSTSQAISILIIAAAAFFFIRWRKANLLSN